MGYNRALVKKIVRRVKRTGSTMIRRVSKKKPMTVKTVKKIINNAVLEKKRFFIAPVALTNGDISCSAPYNAYRNGGAIAALIQPCPLGQQFAQSGFLGTTTIGGWVAMDITPHPQQGTGFGNRIGSSINLISSYMHFQFQQMSVNTVTPIRIKMEIVEVIGQIYGAASTAITTYYMNSALPNGSAINGNNGIIDYNSNIDMDERSNFRVVYRKSITLHQDNVEAGVQVKEHKIKLKYKRGLGHKIRFFQNQALLADGQLMMFITADAGNINDAYAFTGTGSQTLINNAPSSGAFMNFNIAHYFVDA